jgi:hypothetical protein
MKKLHTGALFHAPPIAGLIITTANLKRGNRIGNNNGMRTTPMIC